MGFFPSPGAIELDSSRLPIVGVSRVIIVSSEGD